MTYPNATFRANAILWGVFGASLCAFAVWKTLRMETIVFSLMAWLGGLSLLQYAMWQYIYREVDALFWREAPKIAAGLVLAYGVLRVLRIPQ